MRRALAPHYQPDNKPHRSPPLPRVDALAPDLAQALAREALAKTDDSELYLRYRATESFGFADCGYCDRRFVLIGGVADRA